MFGTRTDFSGRVKRAVGWLFVTLCITEAYILSDNDFEGEVKHITDHSGMYIIRSQGFLAAGMRPPSQATSSSMGQWISVTLYDSLCVHVCICVCMHVFMQVKCLMTHCACLG